MSRPHDYWSDEALGDRRSRAITLGDIARLRANKGRPGTPLMSGLD